MALGCSRLSRNSLGALQLHRAKFNRFCSFSPKDVLKLNHAEKDAFQHFSFQVPLYHDLRSILEGNSTVRPLLTGREVALRSSALASIYYIITFKNLNLGSGLRMVSYSIPYVVKTQVYSRKKRRPLPCILKLTVSYAQIYDRLDLRYSNRVGLPRLSEGSPNKENADRAKAYAYNGDSAHNESPKRGLALGYQVLFVSLICAVVIASLCRALSLFDRGQVDAGLPYLCFGVFGMMAGMIVGFSLIFGGL